MRALIEQWESMSPPAIVGRDAELRALFEALKHPGSIVELVAQVGMGKTTLLKKFVNDNAATFDGAIEYFSSSPAFKLTEAVTVVADRFGAASGHSLLIIDGADLVDARQTLEGIKQLETGPWRFSTVLASHRELGIGTPIRLPPLNAESFVALLDRVFDAKIDPETTKRLLTATGGNPSLARVLEDQWRAGHVPDVAALAALLSPWRAPGLVGMDGRPLRPGGEGERRIITDVRVISDAFVRQVADDPRLMFEMPPRRFEEFVAELLERHGYTVTLTPQTRDGGKDIYAARRDDVGSFLYVVECKRHAPDRPVGVGVVRALHGVAEQQWPTVPARCAVQSLSARQRPSLSSVPEGLSRPAPLARSLPQRRLTKILTVRVTVGRKRDAANIMLARV